eukprot:511820-Prymnesium_polylepis.1
MADFALADSHRIFTDSRQIRARFAQGLRNGCARFAQGRASSRRIRGFATHSRIPASSRNQVRDGFAQVREVQEFSTGSRQVRTNSRGQNTGLLRRDGLRSALPCGERPRGTRLLYRVLRLAGTRTERWRDHLLPGCHGSTCPRGGECGLAGGVELEGRVGRGTASFPKHDGKHWALARPPRPPDASARAWQAVLLALSPSLRSIAARGRCMAAC